MEESLKRHIAASIEAVFGGYRHPFNEVNLRLPLMLARRRRVGVVGGGLAGISAAALLGERGFEVTLYEKSPYLGGKLAGWQERLADGFDASVEHGFHAFFRHYYNLDDFLRRIGACTNRETVGTYTVLTRQGRALRFGDDDGGPLLNLIGLARRGVYDLRDVALNPRSLRLVELLRYHPRHTFSRLDGLPFSAFAERARLPDTLKTVFTTFSRVFFADAHELSTAELIKSFHFFYLGQNLGLVFDVVCGGYAEAFTAPAERYLREHGVEIRTSTEVASLEAQGDGIALDGKGYDAVVVAADVRASRALLEGSRLVRARDPQLHAKMGRMHAGRRYAVWRLWLDRRTPPPGDVPTFVSTERVCGLDAVAFVDRTDPQCRSWAGEHGGGVVELHAYTVSENDRDEDAIKTGLRRDFERYFPVLAQARIVHEHLQVRDDFTALHVGMARHRPGVYTAIPGLLLAGDWVSLPFPSMLMEAAHTSARCAVNALLRAEGLRENEVSTVPTRGLLSLDAGSAVRRRLAGWRPSSSRASSAG